MPDANIEQDRLQFDCGVERLKEEVAVLEAQLAGLEFENSHSPALLRMLGNRLGFGAAGKLDWTRFKLKLKQEELDHFEAQYGMPGVTAQHSVTAS